MPRNQSGLAQHREVATLVTVGTVQADAWHDFEQLLLAVEYKLKPSSKAADTEGELLCVIVES